MKIYFPNISTSALLALIILPAMLKGQGDGSISGVIVDAATGEPLIGANVMILGQSKGAVSDLDGNYLVRGLAAGAYDVQFSYVSYSRKTVTAVSVRPGSVTALNVSLASETVQVGEVLIEAERVRNSEAALLALQMKSATVSDAVSEEQIRKSPDSDAADAVKRVTGISVVDGKYTYVRGLGERYSNTQLNNVAIPSPEPEKKVVPFDLFPSNMIQNLITEKTFTPDQPGNFSGGSVRINTREFPRSFTMSAGLSTGFNTETASNEIPNYRGGSLDFLGLDDGGRALPSAVPSAPPEIRPTAEQSAQLASHFESQWTPALASAKPNLGMNFSIGNRSEIDEMPLGYLASLSYSSDYSFREKRERYPTMELDQSTGLARLKDDYTILQGTYSVLWGALLNVSLRASEADKITLKTIYNHSADDEARIINGFSDQGSSSGYYKSTRLQFVSRSILSSVLAGEHQLADFLDSRIEWKGSFSMASREEPDNRETVYALEQSSGRYFFPNNFGSGNGRFFSNLEDQVLNGSLDWSFPLDGLSGRPARIRTGIHAEYRDRDFSARRFLFSNVSAAAQYLSPEELFTPDQIAAGNIDFLDATQPNDRYKADESTIAAFAMIDLDIAPRLRLIGGVRYEDIVTEVRSFDPFGAIVGADFNASLNDVNILPALSIVYSLTEKMNLRAAASRTIARPEFRELAPFRFDDYRTSTYGNAALMQTDITNFDLRWEWYPTPGEIIAVSGFAKSFENPIEKVLFPSGNNNFVIPINANDARNIGVEFEIRKNLGFMTDLLRDFNAGVNVTLVNSAIEFREGEEFAVQAIPGLTSISSAGFARQVRPLEGQSPYVVNANLGYQNKGTAVSLLYNVVGERIREISVAGFEDDVYEQPRHVLDVTVSQRIFGRASVKLSVKNILDEDVVFKMGSLETSSYRLGRSVSLGMSYSI